MEAQVVHSGHHEEHDVKRHLKIYLLVFVSLLLGTFITVAAWKWAHFPSLTITIAVALFIASVKAFLVAGFFMHLMSEKKAVYAIIGVTVVFFAGLMYLTVWSRDQTPRGTQYWGENPGNPGIIQTPKH